MFFRRDGTGEDRWLGAKIALFSVGAALAVVGMALRIDWLVWVAVAVLASGVLLRLLAARSA